MVLPDALAKALTRPVGARFRRCALQVNPYPYLSRAGKTGGYADADAYNAALVEALVSEQVELIGITDHDRSDDAGLRAAAKGAGITVFPGTEVCSSDGVHVLVLFDPTTDNQVIEHFLGWCEVDLSVDECRPCKRALIELLAHAREQQAVTVLPHVVAGRGLFTELNGQPLVRVWTFPGLVAIAIPSTVDDLNQRVRRIVRLQDPSYKRDFPVAILNANDVSGPADVHLRAWTWVKSSSDTIEGLRQAFLDPESRIRLSSDPDPAGHSELLAVAWDGGFLDGCRLRLNENLNVLIGGRGAGKSTVIESIRYVLGGEPLGTDATEAHEGIVEKVLGPGTTVSLLARSIHPDHRRYVIRRTFPNPPVVIGEDGRRLPLEPRDLLPNTEIFGQHEIAELARRPERRTALLNRFVASDPVADADSGRVQRELARSRERILGLLRERGDLDADLARLPVLEEQVRRFEEAGVEERLQTQARFTREAAILDRADETVREVSNQVEVLLERGAFDLTFIAPKVIDELPSQDLLQNTKEVLENLQDQLRIDVTRAGGTVASARGSLARIRASWTERRNDADAEYLAALRSLGRESAAARTFVEVRRTLEKLRPLRGRRIRIEEALGVAGEERAQFLQELAALSERRDAAYHRAAKRVTRELRDLVRVSFRSDADRRGVMGLVREAVGGRLDSVQGAIMARETLSPTELARACRAGPEALQTYLPAMTSHQAERVCAGMDEAALMHLEEVTLGPALDVALNVASGSPARWRELDDLSTGQKATAILLLLLLESDEPLIVDQPEDDLDNEFISDGIVPRIREAKRTRQFLFSTHNANIPVLGDAELIAVLRASGEAGVGQGDIDPGETGSIDSQRIRKLVEQFLEGGHAAFEKRRRKYGF